MKTLAVLVFVSAVVILVEAEAYFMNEDELKESWDNFKAYYNRNYKDPDEEKFRRELYFERGRKFDWQNSTYDGNMLNYKLSTGLLINLYVSDYTDEEIATMVATEKLQKLPLKNENL